MVFMSYIILTRWKTIFFSWGRINKVGENIVGDVVFHHQWLIVSGWRRAIFFW